MTSDRDITYFAHTNHRNTRVPFGIRRADRRNHMYVIGKTGTGKSTLLKTLVLQDIAAGEGLALFDPHGDLAEEIVSHVPTSRRGDLMYLNVPDLSFVWHFNPFAGIPKEKRALASAGMVEVFKKLWPDDWGPRLEHLLRNVVFTLLEAGDATFADIPRLLSDKDFRASLVQRVSNEMVREFWIKEFAGYSFAFRAVVTAPLLNKVGAFLTDPLAALDPYRRAQLVRPPADYGRGQAPGGEPRQGKDRGRTGGAPGVAPSLPPFPRSDGAGRPAAQGAPGLLPLPRRVPHLRHTYAGHHAVGAAQVPTQHDPGPPVPLPA